MTGLKILAAILGAAACLIPYLALTDEFERTSLEPPEQARVLSIDEDTLRYERFSPGSSWDEDGDGWVGPYSDDDVPRESLASLAPGDPLVTRGGELVLSLAPPTKLLLVGFVVCLIFGGLWVAQPMIERKQLASASHDPVLVIKLMLRRSRSRSIGAGLVLVGVGAAIAFMGFMDKGAETWQRGVILGLGGLSALLGLPSMLAAWRLRNVERAPVLDIILNHPEQMVWMYEHVVNVNGINTHNLFLHTAHGERFDFMLGDLPAAALIYALRVRLPHALVGYSEERLTQWTKAPDCLLDSESETFLQNAPGDGRPRAF